MWLGIKKVIRANHMISLITSSTTDPCSIHRSIIYRDKIILNFCWIKLKPGYLYLSENLTFPLWCVPLIQSGSLNWPSSTKNIGSVRNLHVQVYRSIWHKIHYDVSSEGLDRHYHKYSSSSCWTRWDINHNVCLDLQNCCYSIYTLPPRN